MLWKVGNKRHKISIIDTVDQNDVQLLYIRIGSDHGLELSYNSIIPRIKF
jgi:hypothetical protein